MSVDTFFGKRDELQECSCRNSEAMLSVSLMASQI